MAKSDNRNDSPPRGQKSLTSFFGAAKSSKTGEAVAPRKRQSGLKSGLKKQAASAKSKNDGAPPKKQAKPAAGKQPDGAPPPALHKENVENDEEAEVAGNADGRKPAADLMDTDDDEDVKMPAKKRPAAEDGSSSKRKRVIDDESDDDDDVKVGDLKGEEESSEKSPEKPAAAEEKAVGSHKKAEEENDESSDDEEPAADDDESASDEDPMDEDSELEGDDGGDDGEEKKPGAKKQRTLGGKAVPAPRSKPAAKAGSKSAQSADNKKSNGRLAGIMSSETSGEGKSRAPVWHAGGNGSTPYSALASAFEAIEGVTGKLDRTELLADLFRKVLLRDGGGGGEFVPPEGDGKLPAARVKKGKRGDDPDPGRSDLYTLLYLSSNAVAPKHENVELGVGDSILVKAIGEASGTKNDRIKSMYEEEGDLGDVAMSCKGRQKTLMFGAGPRSLGCGDVLGMFKEIVSLFCLGPRTFFLFGSRMFRCVRIN